MRQIKEILSGPWTATKLWTVVSVPLSVAGIANVTQSFMELGSLIVYALVFYNKIFGPMVDVLKNFIPIKTSKYFIDYLVIISPYGLSYISIYVYNNPPFNKNYGIFINAVVTLILALPIIILVYIVCPISYLLVNTKLGSANQLAKAASAIALSRYKMVLIAFFIVAAFSFGIERWIDPDFLKLQPEHIGIKRPSTAGPN